jgi:hypothetical protein
MTLTAHSPLPPLLLQGLHQKWLGAKADLALLAIICSGNDYLPGVRGVSLTGNGGLWEAYRRLRGTARWGARWVCGDGRRACGWGW